MHPRHIFRIIEERRIDHITAVPEIYALLRRLKEPGRTLPSLKVFVSGGSVLSADEYARIRQTFGVEVLHGYGLTEFAPASRNMRGQARAGTVGPVDSEKRRWTDTYEKQDGRWRAVFTHYSNIE